MHFLIVSPEGLYLNTSSSFVHNQLIALRNEGIEVTVIIPIAALKKDSEGNRFNLLRKTVIDGITIYYVRYLSFSSWGRKNINVINAKISTYLFCKLKLRKTFFDLIWCHTLGFGSEIGKSLKGLFRRPLVVTTHGGDTEEFVQSYLSSEIKVNYIDMIITVSDKLRKKLESFKIGVPIKNAVNGFRNENLAQGALRKQKIIEVGHLITSKHFDITIKAVSILRQHGYDIKFDVVGEGREKDSLKKLAQDHGVIESVIFHGEKDNKEILKMMSESMFFVMPSYPEGLGIVYLEAMASGCITVGTKNEGIDGIIINGKNGFLVDRDDANEIAKIIEDCLMDENLCKRISENAKITAQRFTWGNNVKECLRIIKENVGLPKMRF